MSEEKYKVITDLLDQTEYSWNEPMKRHTSFKIGGPAKLFITPSTKENLCRVIKSCKENELEFHIIGNGSNLLVGDEGIDAIVIQIAKNLNHITIEDDVIVAEAGILLSTLSKTVYREGFKGLEFASGIPGTLGGAIFMNAGAYGGEMKDVLVEVSAVDEKGNIIIINGTDLELGYRSSVLQKRPLIAISAKMTLVRGDKTAIKAVMDDLALRRKTKQPVEKASAGSTFKRPEGYFAGKLIMDAGLMGARIGGAMVSEKHAGFIINEENATCKDVLALIKYVQKTVLEKYGVELEAEVRKLGV